MFVAAVAVTAGALTGAAVLGGVFDRESSRPGTVAAQTTADGPAPAPAHDRTPEPVTRIPDDDRAQGLVYKGLDPAPKGDRCAGVLRTTDGRCTHGPDKPPKGVDIAKDTPPAVKTQDTAASPDRPATDTEKASPGQPSAGTTATVDARQAGSAAAKTPPAAPAPTPGTPGGKAAAPGQTVQCDGDGTTGNRVQVVYVHAPGNDRYAEYLGSFRTWAADADTIYFASAQETGGVRHIRFVTGADCTPSVLNVEVPGSALSEFSAMNSALAAKGFDRRDRKYMIFADAKVYCGIGTFNGDERPGPTNLSNFGPSYGRTDAGCWGGSTAAHELGHNLGAVNNSAPNTSRAAHCTDEWDVMCYSDAPYYPTMRNVCTERGHDERLDCNHDDYFHTSPQPGSYLATHWNVANNQFLMTGNGTRPDPGPNPTPTPTPKPTGSTGPSTGPVPVVGQLTSDSAVVSWPAAPSAAWYQLLLNGSHLAWVQPNSARIQHLRPDTDYTIAVAVRDQAGRDARPGRAVTFHTPPVSSTTTKPGTRYTLTNGHTGMAAEIWGGKTADGTVLVGSQPNGFTPQQWYLDDNGRGSVRLRSAVSGKCLQLGGAASVGQWVAQQPCSGDAAQQWKLTRSGDGLHLAAGDGSLVLSVGKRPYYGAWLLELQKPDSSGYQSWTLQKAS
ncbi:RICIN domain-containing protein [Streptomyces sp. SCA3-4]|uniref:RICIN domain-containing protein n=1 Tax=Streptomyces sichuanensis TaxID=2871810 RepID=UPI001CE2EC77|nr:RICIN domain-containing protein [Streptomyces sichuanensis]MCA6091253.1 RICIN domain-containing protein [Streptomyces sichuanensis]